MLAAGDRLAEFARPTGVALVAPAIECAVLEDGGRDDESAGHRVHPADVGVEQVVAFGRLAAQLRVEVHPAGGESTAAQDLEHPERHLLDRHGETVEVPAETIVAGVGVDRSEDPVGERGGDLVGEVVARQRGVVHLDVDLDLVLQPVLLRNECTAATS